MKKKIGLGIVATMLAAGAFVFANNAAPKDSGNCPNHPGCVCPKAKTEQSVQKNATDKKEACPNDPKCICDWELL